MVVVSVEACSGAGLLEWMSTRSKPICAKRICHAPCVRRWLSRIDKSNGLRFGRDLTILLTSFSICAPKCIILVTGRICLKMLWMLSQQALLKEVLWLALQLRQWSLHLQRNVWLSFITMRRNFLFIAVQKVTFFILFFCSRRGVVMSAMEVSSSSMLLSFGRTCKGGAVRSNVNSLVIFAACSLIPHCLSALVDWGVADKLLQHVWWATANSREISGVVSEICHGACVGGLEVCHLLKNGWWCGIEVGGACCNQAKRCLDNIGGIVWLLAWIEWLRRFVGVWGLDLLLWWTWKL